MLAVHWRWALFAASLSCAQPRREAPPPGETAITRAPEPGPVVAAAEPVEPAPTPAEVGLQAMDELETLRWTESDAARRKALHQRVAAAVAALSDDDPRALEVLCRVAVGRVHTGPAADELWRRAVAIEARRPALDPRTRDASLLRAPLELYARYVVRSTDTLRAGRIERIPVVGLLPSLEAEACAGIDRAQIWIELALRVGPRQQLLDELYAEIGAELGREDPSLATLLEYGAMGCNWTSCFERALVLRERGLGPEHALTRTNRLNLAMSLGVQGAAGRRAELLLRRVVAAKIRDRSTFLALRELGARDLLRRRWQPAARRLSEASLMIDEVLDPKRDGALIEGTRWLHVYAALHVGDAMGAHSTLLRMQADSVYRDDPRWFSYELAEVLCAAGRFAEAIVYYDQLIAAWRRGREGEGRDRARERETVARALRARAAALARLDREAERQQDLDRAVWVELFGPEILGPLEQGEAPAWMAERVRRRKATSRVKNGR